MIEVTQILPQACELYPWTHRVTFGSMMYSRRQRIEQWTQQCAIGGVWLVGNNGTTFYTNGAGVTALMLRWS